MIKFSQHSTDGIEELCRFPFAFDKRYAGNLADLQSANFQLLKFEGDLNGYVPVLLKNSKLIDTLTLLYTPLSLDGMKFSEEEERAVLNELVKFVGAESIADRITQPINWALFQSHPDNAIKIPFGTYELDLTIGEEEIWKGLHSKHRNVIRNAEKKEAELRTGKDELDTFYKLYESTMGRSSMYCEPKAYFEALMNDFEDQLYCAVVYQDDVPQGGIFVPYTQEGAYYVYGASADKITLTGAINFLHYEMIKFLISKGVKKYDFVGARLSDIAGTKYEGIQKFKKRFGGTLKEGYLWKLDVNKAKCKVFDAAVKVKSKMKGMSLKGDIIDQELKKF